MYRSPLFIGKAFLLYACGTSHPEDNIELSGIVTSYPEDNNELYLGNANCGSARLSP